MADPDNRLMPVRDSSLAHPLRLLWLRYGAAKWGWHILLPVGLSIPAGLLLTWTWTMLDQGEYLAAMLFLIAFLVIGLGAALAVINRIVRIVALIAVLVATCFSAAVIWKRGKDKPWSALWGEPAMNVPNPMPGPTFRESLKDIKCHLGPLTITPDQISESEYACLQFEGYRPFTFKKKGNRLLVDAVVYGLDGKTNAEIKENEITIRSELDWDLNWSDAALEIVDEARKPVLQIIYQTPSRVRVNGVFPTGNGRYVLLTDSMMEQGPIGSPVPPEAEQIPRLFKYPSWRYRGEYQ